MPTKVFFVVPVEPRTERVSLRRYRSSYEHGECTASGFGYHNAETLLGDMIELPPEPGHDDPRWPTTCTCGYQFREIDEWQLHHNALFCRYDGQPGQWTLHDIPAGGMWSADWFPKNDFWRNTVDGLALIVKLPNGHDWHVDGPCSNCTRKNEPHKCWIRHGDVRSGDVHVDKNGDTCAAGAGSIQSGNYHGFLHNGYLTDGT